MSKPSEFMRFWKTLNDLLKSHGVAEMAYGEARQWYQQYQGWNGPLDVLRYHVSGAIARGEKEAIVEVTAPKA